MDTLKRHTKNVSNTSSVGIDDIATLTTKNFSKIQQGYPYPKNWCPIVLNTFLSKLLEQVLNEQLITFMQTSLQNQGSWALVLMDQSAAFNALDVLVLIKAQKITQLEGKSKCVVNGHLSNTINLVSNIRRKCPSMHSCVSHWLCCC